jgi:aryl-alcohol dehydrogenase-like predicted oxidoreductase
MKYIKIPEIDQEVSRLALGVNKTGNKNSSSISEERKRIYFYHKAMSLGINLFDTAELYGGGYSEEILGKALADRRSSALICSKFNARNSKKNKLKKSLEYSLKRLGTDYIDFYVAHWPNPNVPIEDIVESLNEFKKEGKIRAFGLSNAVYGEVNEFRVKNNNNFFIVENEYNIVERSVEKKILPMCYDNNCLFMAYSPLVQGRRFSDNKEINELNKKYSCTTQQLMLYWTNRKEIVSIVRTFNTEHLQDNVGTLNMKVDPADIKILENIFNTKKAIVDIADIEIDNRCYSNVSDAIENKKDLIPSPLLLSERIRSNYKLPPLRVTKVNDKYRILDDFYSAEIKKYWASKICNEDKIEVYIFNDL